MGAEWGGVFFFVSVCFFDVPFDCFPFKVEWANLDPHVYLKFHAFNLVSPVVSAYDRLSSKGTYQKGNVTRHAIGKCAVGDPVSLS